jgi:hypothetical protein
MRGQFLGRGRAFDVSSRDGMTHLIPLPLQRWKREFNSNSVWALILDINPDNSGS